MCACGNAAELRFQSTPPARGATLENREQVNDPEFQSTPPARGATIGWFVIIQIKWDFNPRPPRGGRPVEEVCGWFGCDISIHAPREGGDLMPSIDVVLKCDFNPRPPRGGRL